MLTLESLSIPIVGVGVHVSRTQPNRKIKHKRFGIICLDLIKYDSVSSTNIVQLQ